MKKLKKINKNGFTLIELLLVIALMALAVGVTGDILISLIRSYNKSQVISEIEQNANFVSQKLSKELRNADVVVRLDPAGASPPAVGDLFNEIRFTDSTGTNDITYKVTAGGVVTRNNGAGDQALTVNSFPGGVTVSCLDANGECVGPGVSLECFKLIEDAPQVIKIGLCIEQAGVTSIKSFQGEILIRDTIVIRNTY